MVRSTVLPAVVRMDLDVMVVLLLWCGVVRYSAGFMKSRRKNKNVSLAVRSSADEFLAGKSEGDECVFQQR